MVRSLRLPLFPLRILPRIIIAINATTPPMMTLPRIDDKKLEIPPAFFAGRLEAEIWSRYV